MFGFMRGRKKSNRDSFDDELENKMYFESLIDEFVNTKNIKLIPNLYKVITLKDKMLKTKVIREIHKVISMMEPIDYYYLDVMFRENIYVQYATKPRGNITVSNLEVDGLTTEETITLVGLATFYYDGQLREKALCRLIGYEDSAIIPFIIMRTVDWVGCIKETATNKMKEIISVENFEEVLLNYSLIKRMEKFLRFDYELFNNLVEDVCSKNNLEPQLRNSSKSNNKDIREYSLLKLLYNYEYDIDEILEIITKEKVPSIRVKVIEKILLDITKKDLLKYRNRLLKDKYFKVKSRVLNKLYSYGYFDKVDLLKPYLLDENRTVREDARYYAKKLGDYDFISFYKDNLNFKGAILGLCEVATENEIEFLIGFLAESSGKVSKKVLNTIAAINIYSCEKELVKQLEGQREKTSNEARKILIKNKVILNYDEIYGFYTNSPYKHVVANSMYILCNGSKWTSILYILEFCASDVKEERDFAIRCLYDWCDSFNKSFVQPTPNQREYANEALKKCEKVLTETMFEELKFLFM